MLPSRYTSEESFEDAEACAASIGVCLSTIIPIEPAVAAFGEMLAEAFAGRNADTTEENIQARVARRHPDGALQQDSARWC